jgi:spore maturation protein CgeB
MNIVILGLSITSSWGNVHATTYRSLIKGLFKNGHRITFLERNVPWFASQRDFNYSELCRIFLYSDLNELKSHYTQLVREAQLVIVGSYVPEGVKVGQWVTETAEGVKAFYDIDTPTTLAKLTRNDFEYLHPDLISKYDMYLSFSGGKVIDVFRREYGSEFVKPLYGSVDTSLYYPEGVPLKWDLGYLGTFSYDLQASLDRLLIQTARMWQRGHFIVAGAQYPSSIKWPDNVERAGHLPSSLHRRFYNEQKFTLNIPRREMMHVGHSPGVRLFEAAACAVPVISDYWDGLDDFFRIDEEILVSHSAEETLHYLVNTSIEQRDIMGQRFRRRVLEEHTGEKRARELEHYMEEYSLINVHR